jgi:WD40 repeat protein/uncharacterized caspase-like protein
MIRHFTFLLLLQIPLLLFAQEPELVLPVGHNAPVRSARFTSDSKYLITSGKDRQLLLWETYSGRMVRHLTDCKEEVIDAGFSPGNSYIYAITNSNLYIWSFHNHALLGILPSVSSMVFAKDDKRIFLTYKDGRINERSLPGLKETILAKVSMNPPASESAGIFEDIDSKQSFLCLAVDSSAWIIDLKTRITTERKMNAQVLGAFFAKGQDKFIVVTSKGCEKISMAPGFAVNEIYGGELRGAAWSPSREYLLLWTPYFAESTGCVLWNVEKEETVDLPSGPSVNDTLAVVDSLGNTSIVTGTMRVALPSRWISLANRATISNNGIGIHAANVFFNRSDDSRSFFIPNFDIIRKMEFTPDSKYAVVQTDNGGPLQLWSMESGKAVVDYKSNANLVKFAVLNPDGTKMLIGGYDSTLKQVNTVTGKTDIIFKGHSDIIYSAAYSPDGSRIITNSFDSTARLWDATTGQLVQTYKGHHPNVGPAYFRADGKLAFVRVLYDSVDVYDANLNVSGTSVVARELQYPANTGQVVSRTGRYSIHFFEYGVTILGDTLGDNTKSFSYEEWPPALFAFSPDERFLAMSKGDADTVGIWDISKKDWAFRVKLDIPQRNNGELTGISRLLFSPDNKSLLVIDGNNITHILSTGNFSSTAVIPAEYCSFSANGKYLAAINNGICDIFDWKSMRQLYSYISVSENDFITIDPYRRYDGTATGRKLLYYSCGSEIVDLDQFKELLWVPGLTERIMQNDSINASKLSELSICGITPEVKQIDGNDSYHFIIHPRSGGLGETVVLVNGIEVLRAAPTALKKSGGDYELNVPANQLQKFFVAGSSNTVTVKSYTLNNKISSRGAVITATGNDKTAAAPNLYAVMVGVSDYKGTDLDLKYAAKDATDLSSVLKVAAGKLLNNPNEAHVFIYNLTTSPGHDLLPEKASIKKTFDEIAARAAPNDILFVFFAGHGIMDPATQQFYFLTADASSSTISSGLAAVGISTAELSEWIKPAHIAAQKRILIFDACNSGGFIKELVKIGNQDQGYMAARNDDKGKQLKAIERLNEQSGLFILSASASSQSAYEFGRYAQGILTYSLLRSIRENPEILTEGKYLNVSRWFHAASQMVSELVKENGARQDPQVISNTDFNIGIVDDQVMASVLLPTQKPVFTASVFLNNDENVGDDDLDISKQVNSELTDLSSRGTDNPIIYLVGTNSPEAFTLTGRYEVKNGSVLLRCNLKQHGKIIRKFETEGTVNNLHQLITATVTSAVRFAE